MKDQSYFKKVDNTIQFTQSGNHYPVSDYISLELKIAPIKKSATGTVLNATANALSGSIANGNELVSIYIKIKFAGDAQEIIKLNEEPIVRFSLDYHNIVKNGNELKQALRDVFKQ